MNSFHNIPQDAMVIAARVQAALQLVPRIVGPKEAWVIWMRDGLQAEIVSDAIVTSCSDIQRITWFSG